MIITKEPELVKVKSITSLNALMTTGKRLKNGIDVLKKSENIQVCKKQFPAKQAN
jgi:hypothetical protein